MDWALMIPIVAISVGPIAWVANNWIRAKHGFEPEARGRKRRREGEIDGDRKVMLLTSENEKLIGQVSRLEERIAVLERIATDPAERTAREIEALRDR